MPCMRAVYRARKHGLKRSNRSRTNKIGWIDKALHSKFREGGEKIILSANDFAVQETVRYFRSCKGKVSYRIKLAILLRSVLLRSVLYLA